MSEGADIISTQTRYILIGVYILIHAFVPTAFSYFFYAEFQLRPGVAFSLSYFFGTLWTFIIVMFSATKEMSIFLDTDKPVRTAFEIKSG